MRHTVPVTVKGKHYASVKEASEVTGIPKSTLSTKIKKGNDPDYTLMKERMIIRVYGKQYETIAEAARDIGFSRSYIEVRLDNPKYKMFQRDWPDEFYAERS